MALVVNEGEGEIGSNGQGSESRYLLKEGKESRFLTMWENLKQAFSQKDQVKSTGIAPQSLVSFFLIHFAIILLYAVTVEFPDEGAVPIGVDLHFSNISDFHALQGKQDVTIPTTIGWTENSSQRFYHEYLEVAVMIFVGFGFLMTFLKRYAFSAVSYTMLLSATVILWMMWFDGAWHNVHNSQWEKIPLSLVSLIKGNFAAGAVMITYGALLGKCSPTQLMIVALCEVFFYSLNVYVCEMVLEVTDVGGSLLVHTFGAYFGLAVSMMMKFRKMHKYHEIPQLESRYDSDLSAFVGTVWLWLFWPSFNGALADEGFKWRVIINTVLSLCSAVAATFYCSGLMRKRKFDMVDIQNATLAGGVAIGGSCALIVHPFAAMLVGTGAGILSVVGYVYIQPALEKYLWLHDTCGVNNLHGMPGIMGGLCSVLFTAIYTKSSYHREADYDALYAHGSSQWAIQILCLATTLVIAIGGGVIAGCISIIWKAGDFLRKEVGNDNAYFHVPVDYNDFVDELELEEGPVVKEDEVSEDSDMPRSLSFSTDVSEPGSERVMDEIERNEEARGRGRRAAEVSPSREKVDVEDSAPARVEQDEKSDPDTEGAPLIVVSDAPESPVKDEASASPDPAELAENPVPVVKEEERSSD